MCSMGVILGHSAIAEKSAAAAGRIRTRDPENTIYRSATPTPWQLCEFIGSQKVLNLLQYVIKCLAIYDKGYLSYEFLFQNNNKGIM